MEVSAMSIYKKRAYRRIWEEHHAACILSGMHIHHIDGNRDNNDPSNLLLCSPREHYEIHLSQGDYGAAIMLWKNFLQDTDIDIRKIASERLKRTHRERKACDPIAYAAEQSRRSKGKKRSQQQKENYVEGAKKRLADPTFRSRLSSACKGPRKKRTCNHCGKIGSGGNMGRYHFDNCKHKS